jgi:hypothetical protein
MLLSRKITAAFIATFLLGGMAGGLLEWDVTDTKLSDFMKHTADPDSMVTRIDQKYLVDYKLTPDQVARIQPLTTDMAQHLFQIRNQFGLDIISSLKDYHSKVSLVLTPDQNALYDKDNADRIKRMTGLLVPNQSSPPAPQK